MADIVTPQQFYEHVEKVTRGRSGCHDNDSSFLQKIKEPLNPKQKFVEVTLKIPYGGKYSDAPLYWVKTDNAGGGNFVACVRRDANGHSTNLFIDHAKHWKAVEFVSARILDD
jgi:hypothetical protein